MPEDVAAEWHGAALTIRHPGVRVERLWNLDRRRTW